MVSLNRLCVANNGTVATELNKTINVAKHNPSPNLLVTEEEIFIILVVLSAWIFVICLFFKKWGKIRMLEPYHPEYQEPVASTTVGPGTPGNYKDRYRLNVTDMPACFSSSAMAPDRAVHLSDIALPLLMHARPRINSMFVYSQKHREAMANWNFQNNSRKVRSAEDINMVVVHQPPTNQNQESSASQEDKRWI